MGSGAGAADVLADRWRYGAAGAKKFAFHVPAGFPNTMESGGKEVFEGPAIFPTAWFSEREHALAWFREG